MTNNIFMVYIEEKTKKGNYDSCVIAVFDKEEDAKDYCEYCKEDRTKGERYYYVSIEINKCVDIVNWYRMRK